MQFHNTGLEQNSISAKLVTAVLSFCYDSKLAYNNYVLILCFNNSTKLIGFTRLTHGYRGGTRYNLGD